MRNILTIHFCLLIIIGNFYYSCDNCDSSPKKQDTDSTIKVIGDYFQEKFYPQYNPKRVNIVIDVSQSMQGFSAASMSFNQFLSSVDGSIATIPKYWFSLSGSLDLQKGWIEFLNKPIFSASESKFPLIKGLLNDTTSLTVFITDLQFNNIRYFDEFSKIFRENVTNEKYVYVNVANLYFDGNIFPDMVFNCIPFKYNGNRPIFIISYGNKKYLDFNQKLITNTGLIINSQLPLIKEVNTSVYAASKCNLIKTMGKSPVGVENKLIFKGKEDDSLKFKLSFSDNILKYWDNITQNNIICEKYELTKKGSLLKSLKFSYTIGSLVRTNNTIDFLLTTEKITTTRPQIIRISIRINSLPNWVDSLNINQGDPCNKHSNHILLLKDLLSWPIKPIAEPFDLTSAILILE